MFLFAFNNPVSQMLMKKSLKAFAISLGFKIILLFANLNSCGKSRFPFVRFKVSLIVYQVFCKLVEYLLNTW